MTIPTRTGFSGQHRTFAAPHPDDEPVSHISRASDRANYHPGLNRRAG
ncbi:hypothetical protein RR11_1882 [Ruegeria sp. R11]|nr:hypothetical protein RR11_1882 [Ruegeria sp. R11]